MKEVNVEWWLWVVSGTWEMLLKDATVRRKGEGNEGEEEDDGYFY